MSKDSKEEILKQFELINHESGVVIYWDNVLEAMQEYSDLQSSEKGNRIKELEEELKQFKPNAVEVEKLREKLDSKQFYDVMQSYRYAPQENQDIVIKKYEAVMQWIQDNCLSKEKGLTKKDIQELDDIFHGVDQVFVGWHSDGTSWSEYDQMIHDKVNEFRKKHTYNK